MARTWLDRSRWQTDDFDEIDGFEEANDTDAHDGDAAFDGRASRHAARPRRRERQRARIAEVDAGRYDEPDDYDEVEDLIERKERERRRATISEPFKCRHCRAFIGAPPTGGQQRNHCPMCLYSLHVDDRTPGDRLSTCRSLMQPVGVFYRRNLEQVVVHRCLGCGFVRYNRIAADDNPVLLAELPVVDPESVVASSDQ
jgi:hypothetical protein